MKTKRFAALLLVLLFAVSAFTPVFAEGEEEDGVGLSSQSIVEDYSVTTPSGKLTKGATAVIVVKVRNPLLLTADGKAIDVTRTSDSFKGGSVSVAVTSADDKPLEYTVTFTDVQYTGKGNSLNSFVLYRDCDLPVEPLNVTVEECVEYVEPTADPKPLPVPELQINRGEMEQPVKAGESFKVSVNITNASAAAANGVIAVFEPGEGLMLEESKTSKAVGTVGANGSASVTVALKAAGSIETTPLTLGVSLKYTYAAAEGTAEGAAEEKLLIPAAVSKANDPTKSSAATPNIIVTKYSCGKDSVAAGEKFKLTVSFCNTSKTTAVDNIVMAVDTGESLSITSASNTYYFAALKPNETRTQTIEMQVPANAAVTSAKAEISFRYEYVSAGERVSANASESLSVPVYLPDRFSLAEPELLTAVQGSEVNVSVPYVNRGKSEVGNVEAKIVFAAPGDATCEQPSQMLGNFEAGKSGTIDFFFTPNVAGELKFNIVVSYEDEMTEPKTITLPLTLTVEESVEDDILPDDGDMDGEEEHAALTPALIAAAVGAPVLAGVVVFVVLRRKKKKKAADTLPEGFDWGDGAASEQEQDE